MDPRSARRNAMESINRFADIPVDSNRGGAKVYVTASTADAMNSMIFQRSDKG